MRSPAAELATASSSFSTGLRHQLDLLAVEPPVAGDQHRLSRFQKIALGAQHLAENRDLEGARLVGALHEGKAVALGRGALQLVDHRAGELDAARRAALQERRAGRPRASRPAAAGSCRRPPADATRDRSRWRRIPAAAAPSAPNPAPWAAAAGAARCRRRTGCSGCCRAIRASPANGASTPRSRRRSGRGSCSACRSRPPSPGSRPAACSARFWSSRSAKSNRSLNGPLSSRSAASRVHGLAADALDRGQRVADRLLALGRAARP